MSRSSIAVFANTDAVLAELPMLGAPVRLRAVTYPVLCAQALLGGPAYSFVNIGYEVAAGQGPRPQLAS